MEDMEGKEFHTRVNFFHSRFPHWKTHTEPFLDSQVPPSACRKRDIKNHPSYSNSMYSYRYIEQIALSAGCRINGLPTL
jgi:hypothetical protein